MTDERARTAVEEVLRRCNRAGHPLTEFTVSAIADAVAQAVRAERDRLLDEFSDALKAAGVRGQRQVYPFPDALKQLAEALRREEPSR